MKNAENLVYCINTCKPIDNLMFYTVKDNCQQNFSDLESTYKNLLVQTKICVCCWLL